MPFQNTPFGDDNGDGFDAWAYGPAGGRLKQWLAGVGIAGVLIALGLYSLHSGQTILYGRGGTVWLSGPAATAMAVAYLSFGAFLHFHYFWGLSLLLLRWSQPLKVIALISFGLSIATMIY